MIIKVLKGICWKKMSALLLCFIVSIIILVSVCIYHFTIKKDLEASKNTFFQLQEETRSAIENNRILSNNLKPFVHFSNSGYIGPANRLQWIETLQSVVDQQQIPQVRFTLSPTKNFGDSDSELDQIDSNLFITTMSLDMELMHEGDFFQLLTQMREKSLGVFRVDYCTLKEAEKNFSDKPIKVTSNCRLSWLNYRDIRQAWETSS